MSDFMPWLYAGYIRPQLQTTLGDDYTSQLNLVKQHLPPNRRQPLEKCLELTASQAFLLGLRTGAGLSSVLTQQES